MFHRNALPVYLWNLLETQAYTLRAPLFIGTVSFYGVFVSRRLPACMHACKNYKEMSVYRYSSSKKLESILEINTLLKKSNGFLIRV